MQRIFSVLGQAFRKSILILAMLSLISLSSLFIFVEQPSLAAPISTEGQKLIQQEKMDKESETANLRQQEYEEEVEAEKDPEKVYEKNLKAYEESNPDEGIIQKAVEGTKGLIEKVTGKE